jgi:PH/SEC7 domain-containing protein
VFPSSPVLELTWNRDLCAKLHLKAESQEIDRIIEAFSARYYDCNPATIFATPGVVHTITAAMLMLNTDLHIADLNKHMSRSDFVRNALRAISLSTEGAPGTGSTPDLVKDNSSKFGGSSAASIASVTVGPNGRMKSIPAPRSASAPVVALAAGSASGSASALSRVDSIGGVLEQIKLRGSQTTVGSFSYTKAWESDAESALKVSRWVSSQMNLTKVSRISITKFERIRSFSQLTDLRIDNP